MSEVIQLGNCMANGKRENPNQGRVYDQKGIAPCLTSMKGGNLQPMIIEEKQIVRMIGRNPDNPSDRTPGIELEQRLEPNSEGICNTLTTVQKDNLVLEETIKIKQATKQGYIDSEIVKIEKNGFYEQAIKTAEKNNAKEGDIIDAFNQKVLTDGISPTITTRPEGKKTAILPIVERYRIRKLTPRECFRLMNVEEEQFNRAEKVVSNSQLYKVAGNAIVVSVLCALFSQLGIQGKKKWNDMTEEERIALVHKNTVMEVEE